MYGNYYGGYNGYYPPNQPADTLTQLRNQQMHPFTPQQQQPPTQGSNGLLWVQGEAGAKSYLVAPNTTIMLMDSENPLFYLKSSDTSGMPLPLRRFRYEEIVENNQSPLAGATQNNATVNLDKYVTHDQLRSILADMANTGNTLKKTDKKQKEDDE